MGQEDVQEEPAIDPTTRAEAAELVQIAARARRAFPRGGLDITTTQVLLALACADAGRGVAETAGELALDASTVSHAIRALRDQELVSDATDPADGRRRVSVLTPAGERAVSEYVRARRPDASGA